MVAAPLRTRACEPVGGVTVLGEHRQLRGGGRGGRTPAAACRAHGDVPDGVFALDLKGLDQAGDLAPQPGELLDSLIRQGAARGRGHAEAAEDQRRHRGQQDQQQQARADPQVLEREPAGLAGPVRAG